MEAHENKCLYCGALLPEGLHVCAVCTSRLLKKDSVYADKASPLRSQEMLWGIRKGGQK